MKREPELFDGVMNTPLGPLAIAIEQGMVTAVGFPPRVTPTHPVSDPAGKEVVRQLQAYFTDPGFRFTVPVDLKGSDFQLRVWQALREIPPGRVRTYGDLARQLGSSARAVGGACRANPCPILIPCHRVVSANGRGGYAGATEGRLPAIKEWLLKHEGAVYPQ